MTPERLLDLLRAWLRDSEASRAAANLLVDKAAARGQLPGTITLRADEPACEALQRLLPETHQARRSHGEKLSFRLPEFERANGLPEGALASALASLLERTVENRREERARRQSLLASVLGPLASQPGLVGEVARHHAAEAQARRGRFWSHSDGADPDALVRQMGLYFRLLERLDALRDTPVLIRAVHLGREIAGDSHWLRPGTLPWRWAAEDLARALPDLACPSHLAQTAKGDGEVLARCGIVESLTSVRVLVHGNAALRGPGFRWAWPAEAAREGTPVWLSAAHLQKAELVAGEGVTTVTTVENETSFWDLLEQASTRPGEFLVYTEGHANRAVVQALRQLAAAKPGLCFRHEGDLDLPGVRILSSLRERTGLPIEPHRMDASTHADHAAGGIPLTASELEDVAREVERARLPCQDLLRAIMASGVRVEQEAVTRPKAHTT